jgi:hypothetical protein
VHTCKLFLFRRIRNKKWQKCPYWRRHVCPFVCPQATTRERLNEFSLNFILGSFTKICHHFILVNTGQQQREIYTETSMRMGATLVSMVTWGIPSTAQSRGTILCNDVTFQPDIRQAPRPLEGHWCQTTHVTDAIWKSHSLANTFPNFFVLFYLPILYLFLYHYLFRIKFGILIRHWLKVGCLICQ